MKGPLFELSEAVTKKKTTLKNTLTKVRHKAFPTLSDKICRASTMRSFRNVFLLFCSFTFAFQVCSAQNFITEWTFTESATDITIFVLTTGDVNYSWTASPSENSGDGIFNQSVLGVAFLPGSFEAGDVVTLELAPENLSRFFTYGPDSERLTNVSQWGDVQWTSMEATFIGCINLDITASDTPNLTGVTVMSRMFENAETFNQDIGNWDVSTVTQMNDLFLNAESFNQDISTWDVSNVVNMRSMFRDASSFNQNVGNWSLHPDVLLQNIFDNSVLDCDHYSSTLAGFRINNPSVLNKFLGAAGVEYGAVAAEYRDALISLQDWVIEGDSLIDEECELLLSDEFASSPKSSPVFVFPNPAMDKICIEGSISELRQVRVFNILGTDISSGTPIFRKAHNEVEADLSSLAKGVYLIKTATQTRRVVKR